MGRCGEDGEEDDDDKKVGMRDETVGRGSGYFIARLNRKVESRLSALILGLVGTREPMTLEWHVLLFVANCEKGRERHDL